MRSITDRYTTENRNRPTRSSGWHYTRAALLARLAASLLLSIAAVGLPATPKAQADQSAAARSGAVEHAQKMRRLFPDHDAVSQALPTFIPRLTTDPDPSGTISSFHPNGPTQTGKNAFFLDLGANGRTCFTCHQPQDGWSLSARHAQERFDADPSDPLFRLVDGATCPSDDVSTLQAKRAAYQLLLSKGLIRIGLPMPSDGLQFQVVEVRDPYGCSTDPRTGLTGSTTGIVSVYRRPLPAANLGFLNTVMWDGREPDLFSQAVNATLGHAQAPAAPNLLQQQQIVSFEGCTRAATPERCKGIPDDAGVFTAQLFDNKAGLLVGEAAKGGPMALSREMAKFFMGINDPLGQNPTGAPFSAAIFNLFGSWEGSGGSLKKTERRNAISRGEQLFNTVRIDINGVAGLNDALGQPNLPGFCGTCHDAPNIGHHSVRAPLNIGIADAGVSAPPALDISGLPVYTLWCTAGPLAGKVFEVTDPGRALITGQCSDIGKLKGPVLRGLAARAPYFHNGSAATLRDVVEFYDRRFNIGLTNEQKADLAAFLAAL